MTTDLTSRYITATVAKLPTSARDDVRVELTGSIADAIEARTDQGESRAAAERAVLTDLGNPSVLAAEYSERPLHLIGPRYYLAWWQLLKTLLLIVPLVVTLGVATAEVIGSSPLGEVIGASLAAGITSALHVFFWVTLVFVVLERTRTGTGMSWDVDQLPAEPETGAGRSDVIASAIVGILVIGVVAWDSTRGLLRTDEGSFAVLHPEQWPVWTLALVTLIVLEVALSVAVFVRGRWTIEFAALNTALSIAFLSWTLTLFGRDRLINPEAVDAFLALEMVETDSFRTTMVVVIVLVIGISVWDVLDGWRKARRTTGTA